VLTPSVERRGVLEPSETVRRSATGGVLVASAGLPVVSLAAEDEELAGSAAAAGVGVARGVLLPGLGIRVSYCRTDRSNAHTFMHVPTCLSVRDLGLSPWRRRASAASTESLFLW
jgi:hypothetical protein